jgi:FkbM family methyltransferase
MKTATSQITVRGKAIEFRYPDSEKLKMAIGDVLGGREYPVLAFPGYQPKMVVDVGANVGAAALYFHSHWPEATIHCFEPAADCYGCLAANVKPFAQIHAHHLGLYDKSTETTLFVGYQQPAQNSVVAYAGTEEQGETIRLVAASTALAEAGIDEISILKLDTEGCEVPILTDLGPRLDGIDLIYLEYHCEEDRRAIDALLAGPFLLLSSRAERLHVGLCVYIHRRMTARYPELEIMRIERPRF